MDCVSGSWLMRDDAHAARRFDDVSGLWFVSWYLVLALRMVGESMANVIVLFV